ncbi:hypothetical protein [Magnetofaba australis]|uniref:Putative integral membrane protein n=1 Tax=Magnetofaba australis IT-1 TaxID=1434232 RepID=A0A1Y2K401_9PROT|nr:hypothetical protein [Magnetofaba australis]OSM01844.1 putative integral membrane protein [Magnetofaba australis IT-1]
MTIALWIVIATLIFFLVVRGLINQTPRIQLAVYLLLPVALGVIFAVRGADITGFFAYIKFVLILSATLFTMGLRYRGWVERPWARLLFYFLILFNLVEAATFDLYDYLASTPEVPLGGSAINFVAWVIIILTLSYPRLLTLENSDKRTLHFDIGWGWVIAYTICDYVFLFGSNAPGEIPGLWGGYNIIQLAVPLLLIGRDASLYMQMRVYALTWNVFLPLAYPHPPLMYQTPDWYGPNLITALELASLAAALYLVWRSWNWVRSSQEGEGAPRNLLESALCRLGLATR